MTRVSVVDGAGARAEFAALPGGPVLLAGLAAGHGLPHECATGTCGSCRATVLEGVVEPLWPDAPGRKACRSASDVLLCQTAVAGEAAAFSVRSAFRPAPSPSPGWAVGRLSRLAALSDDVATFRVEADRPLPYAAGQFVLLTLPGVAGARAYSMIRRHAPGAALEFLIRRAPGGALTGRLFDAGAGTDVSVGLFGPLGRATLSPDERRPLCLIAGGSGIAGILAVLEEAEASGLWRERPGRLWFGLRRPEGAYLLDELAGFADRSGGALSITVAFSDAPADDGPTARRPALRFEAGLVHEVAAADCGALPPPAEAIWFVAGPPPLVDAAMRRLVVERRIDPRDIRYDRFG
jgi:toluene monooxygenase electron transfer component